jgi:predicted RNase H-like HicB family nuclease
MVDVMSVKRKFQVVYEPDDGGWHVHIPTVKGCRTWGRSIPAARKNIREALSLADDALLMNAEKVAATAVFEESFKLPREARAALDAAKQKKAEAAALAKTLAASNAKAAKALRDRAGLSLRDAGVLLEVSQEQVRQLLASGE